MTAPFNSRLTRSSILVDKRLQLMLTVRKPEPAPPVPKQVRVLSITVQVD
jgi:hypothetical protein